VLGVARRESTIDDDAYGHITFDLADTAHLATALSERLMPLVASARRGRVALVNNAAEVGHLGWTQTLAPTAHAHAYAVNVVAPTWLMGFFVEHVPRETTLRIINVSSGAAVRALPGMAAYSTSKAALRMAGMMIGAELDAARGTPRERRDTAVVTYMPWIVETPMQRSAREQTAADFPSQPMFQGFLDSGIVVPPEMPAEEIVGFAESGPRPSHAEEQLTPR